MRNFSEISPKPKRKISIQPFETTPDGAFTRSPKFSSEVFDEETGEKIGFVDFSILHISKMMHIDNVVLDKTGGYGSSLYLKLYEWLKTTLPGYKFQSSDSMSRKRTEEQIDPNAVLCWKKLQREGYAKKIGENKWEMINK